MGRRDIVFFTGIQRLCQALKMEGYRIAILKGMDEILRRDHGCDFVIPYDPDRLEELEKRLMAWPMREQVIAVINRREKRVKELSCLNRALGIDGIKKETAIWTTDKYLMRLRLLEEDSSMIPEFQLVHIEGRCEPIEIPFPILLKPRNLFKSQLIKLCRDIEEVEEAKKEIRVRLDATGLRNGVRLMRSLVAESYLEGREATIDSLIDGQGRIYHTPAVDLIPAGHLGIEDHHIFARILPSQMRPEEEVALQEVVEKAAMSFKIRRSAIHSDLIIKDGRAILLEIGARVGGYRSEMMELAFGFSLDRGNFQVAMGKRPDTFIRFRRAVAVLEFFPEEEGILKGIRGLDMAKGLPSFHRLRRRIPDGGEVGLARQGYRCPLFIFLAHPSRDVVRRDMERLRKSIQIEIV